MIWTLGEQPFEHNCHYAAVAAPKTPASTATAGYFCLLPLMPRETFLPRVTAKCRNSLTLCSNAKNLLTSSPATLFVDFEENCIVLQGAAPLLLLSHLLLGSSGSPVPPGDHLRAQLPCAWLLAQAGNAAQVERDPDLR